MFQARNTSLSTDPGLSTDIQGIGKKLQHKELR